MKVELMLFLHAVFYTPGKTCDWTQSMILGPSSAYLADQGFQAEKLGVLFSEAVTLGTGTIRLYRDSDDALIHTFSLADPDVSYDSGSNTLVWLTSDEVIEPLPSGAYYFLVDEGIVQNDCGANSEATTDKSIWTYSHTQVIQPPTGVETLTATELDQEGGTLNWINLTGGGPKINYVIYVDGAEHAVVAGPDLTTADLSGLAAGTSYDVYVVVRNTAGDSNPSNTITIETLAAAASWDEEVDLQNAGYTELQIKDFIEKRRGGSYPGTSYVVLPDPTYSTSLHVTTAAGNSFRNECGYQVYRLSDLGNDVPVGGSGSLDDLRSEIKVATGIDANGKFLFYGTHKSFQAAVWEVDTLTRSVVFLRETSLNSLPSDYHHTIMPHPGKDDTILYLDSDNTVKELNLRSGTEENLYTFPFSPAIPWGKKDGNGIFDEVIVCAEPQGPHRCFMLHYPTGQAVNTENGVTSLVPIASRKSVYVTPTNTSDLDYIFTDGKFMYAVIKNTAGPDGGSGLFIYDSNGYIGKVLASTTGHYSHQRASFGGAQAFSVGYKLNTAAANTLGGSYKAGDMVSAKIEISHSGGYQFTYTHKLDLPLQYSNGQVAGGQMSGIDSIDDVSGVSMTTAHTTSGNRNLNDSYVSAEFFGKEEIFLFFHESPGGEDFLRLGKNMTRLLQTTSEQTEMNILNRGADGTLYVVFYSSVGPDKGQDLPYVLTDKDAWLMIIPPRMPDARTDYYLAL